MLVVVLRWERVTFVAAVFVPAIHAAIDPRVRDLNARLVNRLESVVRFGFLNARFIKIECHWSSFL